MIVQIIDNSSHLLWMLEITTSMCTCSISCMTALNAIICLAAARCSCNNWWEIYRSDGRCIIALICLQIIFIVLSLLTDCIVTDWMQLMSAILWKLTRSIPLPLVPLQYPLLQIWLHDIDSFKNLYYYHSPSTWATWSSSSRSRYIQYFHRIVLSVQQFHHRSQSHPVYLPVQRPSRRLASAE